MENSLDTQIIILAAGKGTRMNSELPKVLVGLTGKPLIQHLLDNTSSLTLDAKPVIVIGHKYELVQAYLGPDWTYAFQDQQLGTAHAVIAAQPKITAKNVLVLYGDMPFIRAETLNQLIKLHQTQHSVFTMLTTQVPNFEEKYNSFLGFGRIIRDSNEKLQKIEEYVNATESERAIREVNPGIYLFDSEWLWHHINLVEKNKHGEYYLTDLVEIAISEHVPVLTQSIDPLEVYGINTPQQLEIAQKLLV